jgi:hypothetical protein
MSLPSNTLNKADIYFAIKKYLNDVHDYGGDREYKEAKRVMEDFLLYVEEL